jgi:hypothetical protein
MSRRGAPPTARHYHHSKYVLEHILRPSQLHSGGGAWIRSSPSRRTIVNFLSVEWTPSPHHLVGDGDHRRNETAHEEIRVDHCTVLSDVACSSAASHDSRPTATAACCGRPDSNVTTHQYRHYLPGGNGRDVLQRGHQPEYRGPRVEWRGRSDQRRDYHAFSGYPGLRRRHRNCQRALQLTA